MDKRKAARGFTLIEMIVAVALFAIVMLIAGGTLLSLVYANRKAQALQSVTNNLNVSLDDMMRNIREGQNYRCSGENPSSDDCASGGSIIYFTPFGSTPNNQPQNDWAYAACVPGSGGWSVVNSVAAEAGLTDMSVCENRANEGWVPITSSEVQIQNLVFYVVGTTPASESGTQQPKIIFTIKGQAGAQASTISTFDIQASAVQRVLNL